MTNRLLTTQLWNITPHDPLTFAVAILLVLTIGAAACWVPALRAVRVEPMTSAAGVGEAPEVFEQPDRKNGAPK